MGLILKARKIKKELALRLSKTHQPTGLIPKARQKQTSMTSKINKELALRPHKPMGLIKSKKKTDVLDDKQINKELIVRRQSWSSNLSFPVTAEV